MAQQDSNEAGRENGPAEPARKPWATPRLTVSPIRAVTLAAAATNDDGSMGNLLAS